VGQQQHSARLLRAYPVIHTYNVEHGLGQLRVERSQVGTELGHILSETLVRIGQTAVQIANAVVCFTLHVPAIQVVRHPRTECDRQFVFQVPVGIIINSPSSAHEREEEEEEEEDGKEASLDHGVRVDCRHREGEPLGKEPDERERRSADNCSHDTPCRGADPSERPERERPESREQRAESRAGDVPSI